MKSKKSTGKPCETGKFVVINVRIKDSVEPGRSRRSKKDYIVVHDDIASFSKVKKQLSSFFNQNQPTNQPIQNIISNEPLILELGWKWLDTRTKNEIIQLFKPFKLQDFEKYWKSSISFVEKLPSVLRWIAASNGESTSTSIWKFQKTNETLERRKIRMQEMCYFVGNNNQLFNLTVDEYLEKVLCEQFDRLEQNIITKFSALGVPNVPKCNFPQKDTKMQLVSNRPPIVVLNVSDSICDGLK